MRLHPSLTAQAATRRGDPDTSREAARAVEGRLTDLQRQVLAAFGTDEYSARQLERLDAFRTCSPSTVRKRVSELHRAGLLEECGTERDSGRVACTVYRRVQQARQGRLF